MNRIKVTRVDDQQMRPFLYFDQSLNAPSGLVRRNDLEAMLYSLDQLTYSEVSLHISACNRGFLFAKTKVFEVFFPKKISTFILLGLEHACTVRKLA